MSGFHPGGEKSPASPQKSQMLWVISIGNGNISKCKLAASPPTKLKPFMYMYMNCSLMSICPGYISTYIYTCVLLNIAHWWLLYAYTFVVWTLFTDVYLSRLRMEEEERYLDEKENIRQRSADRRAERKQRQDDIKKKYGEYKCTCIFHNSVHM